MDSDSFTIFNDLSTKFSQLMYGRSKGDLNQINKLLEDINNLDYRYPVVNNPTKAVLLIHQCCTLIPPNDYQLVLKCCKLITNLVSREQIAIEGQTLTLAVQWCLQAIKQRTSSEVLDVLIALEVLLRNNSQNAHSLLPVVVNQNSSLTALAVNESSPEVLLLTVQCLEACTSVPDFSKKDKNKVNSFPQLNICAGLFFKFLTEDKPENFDDILHCKLLISCLRGLENIIQQDQEFLLKEISLLMGISKTYMVYGIKGIQFSVPQKVIPSILNIAEPLPGIPKEKKGGKVVKQRKHREINLNKKDTKKPNDHEGLSYDEQFQGYIPAATTFEVNSETRSPSQSRLKTSDSDFSDTEGGRAARLGVIQGRVRQAALSHLLQLLKLLDRHTIFCYWSSLIPDGSSTSAHHLSTCILKDPSHKSRMAALNILAVLLNNSKLYLLQAEWSEKYSAFTPFSVILGAMLKELHQCLSLALHENSILVLIQVLKCMAALVQVTPYHRLPPGILTKIIRNVKAYVKHKDATVQVAALIVFGCIVASEPLVPETKEALLKYSSRNFEQDTVESNSNPQTSKSPDSDVEYDFSSDEEEVVENSDMQNAPWLLERCLNNLGVSLIKDRVLETSVPAPVKLECLQVISAMSRNYFDCLMVPYLNHITKGLDLCLADKYSDLRLHTGRTIDFIGEAMNQHMDSSVTPQAVILQKSLFFWQTLLDGLVALLQCEQHMTLRAVGCDCFGSIGPHTFERLPREKQIVIITLLFGCSRDEENSVKAAAVRALSISVLYPSLREDPGFVVDVAEAINRTLQDSNALVRMKASWSLGNLSDALVLNKLDKNMEEISDKLLLQLLQISIKLSSDNDKIKMNIMRALGNLLQLITPELNNQKEIKDAICKAVNALIKNASTVSSMKVRWNACYAIGNILKNSAIFMEDGNSKSALFSLLMDLVMNFRNFKVRINAALALSSPTQRELYGQHFSIIWNALLNALENAQNVEDFSEYNRRDHLVEQICLAMGHMTTLLTLNDLLLIQDHTVFHLDSFKLHTHKVLERLLPEKLSTLLAAVTHLNNLMLNPDLLVEQKKMLEILLDVFNNDT